MASSRHPRSLRDQQRTFTRGRLLEAALEQFEINGYAATTIEDITNAAGASRATFYLHFTTKSDIVKELMSGESLTSALALYRELDVIPEPSWDELRGFIGTLSGWWKDNKVLVSITRQAVAAEPDEIGPIIARNFDEVASVLGTYLARDHGFPSEEAQTWATLFIALLDRLQFFTDLPGSVVADWEPVLDALTTLWWPAFHGNSQRKKPVRRRKAAVAQPSG